MAFNSGSNIKTELINILVVVLGWCDLLSPIVFMLIFASKGQEEQAEQYEELAL